MKMCDRCGTTETKKWCFGVRCYKCYVRERDQGRKEYLNARRIKYYEANRESENSKRRKRYAENRPREIARQQKYYRENPDVFRVQVLRRQKRIQLASPPWVDKKALREFYRNRPEGLSVDHIIPLVGENVCGLHVPWNLQYLTLNENMRKECKVLSL